MSAPRAPTPLADPDPKAGAAHDPSAALLEQVVSFRLAGWTLARIGERCGLTTRQVHRLLSRAASLAGSPISPTCPSCGGPRQSRSRLCRDCAAQDAAARRLRTCKRCGIPFMPSHGTTYCPLCRTETTTRPCAWCGRPITRDRTTPSFRNKTWFCNRACFGRYMGRHHGAKNLRAWHSRHRTTSPRVVTGRRVVLILPGSCASALPGRSVHLLPDPDGHRLIIRPGPAPEGAVPATVSQAGVPAHAPLTPTRQIFISSGRVARLIPWLRPGTPLRASLRDAEIVVEPDAQP
jgi:hypothetical protein